MIDMRQLPLTGAARLNNGQHVVGIDLGGTKILAGIASGDGRVLAEIREPTAHGVDAPVLDQMARIVATLAEKIGVPQSSVVQLVIGVPCSVNPDTGFASLSPNLALPEDRSLAALMAERVDCPVLIENDVNLAAYAEAIVGIGCGLPSLAFVAFGTGVGMGLVLSGQLIRGAFGRAGEIAYLPVGDAPHRQADRSENGLFEDKVGTPGIRSRYAQGSETVADIFARAESGDQQAKDDIDDLAREASVGIAAIHCLIDPAMTVIGGGIGHQPRFFEQLNNHLQTLLPFDCRLEPSQFGSKGGMIGAIVMAIHTSGT